MAAPPVSQSPDILLISVDTLRVDRLGCYGYKSAVTPTIDNLSKKGTLIRRAYTPTPLTLPAHAALLTGRYPRELGIYDNGTAALGDALTTLTEVLKESGYHTGAFISAYVLGSPFGLDQGFDTYTHCWSSEDLAAALTIPESKADHTVDRAISWWKIESERPLFTFVHLYDPHMPYAPPDEFAGLKDPYDGEVAFVDQQIGRLLAALPDPDNTLIVVVSDHGEGLDDHDEKTHGYYIYETTMRVLMLYVQPASMQPRDLFEPNGAASLVDVMPTILSLAGIDHSTGGDGITLTEKSPDNRSVYLESLFPYLHHGFSPLRGLTDGSTTYIHSPRNELYDLRTDPGQMRNLEKERALDGKTWEEKLRDSLRRIQPLESSSSALLLTSEERGKLKALGYLAGGSDGRDLSRVSGRGLKDPKEDVMLLRSLERATDLISGKKYGEAEKVLRSAERSYPKDVEIKRLLGDLYRLTGDFEAAFDRYSRAARLSPEQPDFLLKTGQALIRLRRYREAASILDAYLKVISGDPLGLYYRGIAAMELKDPDLAEELFMKARREGFDEPEIRWRLAHLLKERGDLLQSDELLSGLLAENPGYFPAWFTRGEVYEKMGRIEKAEDAYRRAFSISRGFLPAGIALAELYLESGRPEECGRVVKDLAAIDPGNPEILVLQGRLALLKGDRERGCAFLKQAESITADSDLKKKISNLLSGCN